MIMMRNSRCICLELTCRRQLEKKVEYNFLVAKSHAMTTSSLDDLNGVEFEDVSGAGQDDGSQVLVKVIDRSAAGESNCTAYRYTRPKSGRPFIR